MFAPLQRKPAERQRQQENHRVETASNWAAPAPIHFGTDLSRMPVHSNDMRPPKGPLLAHELAMVLDRARDFGTSWQACVKSIENVSGKQRAYDRLSTAANVESAIQLLKAELEQMVSEGNSSHVVLGSFIAMLQRWQSEGPYGAPTNAAFRQNFNQVAEALSSIRKPMLEVDDFESATQDAVQSTASIDSQHEIRTTGKTAVELKASAAVQDSAARVVSMTILGQHGAPETKTVALGDGEVGVRTLATFDARVTLDLGMLVLTRAEVASIASGIDSVTITPKEDAA